MRASQILNDQVIHVKKGRFNSFGFEPLWNSYFDFYLDSRYFGKPLLELADVTLHLYLRKNLNDKNPDWKMPTIRQMKKKFHVSQGKLEAMLRRLDAAQLLKKVSGQGKGEHGEHVANHYVLSDPIQTLQEFLLVANAGEFSVPLKAVWCGSAVEEDAHEPDTDNTPVPEIEAEEGTEFDAEGVPESGAEGVPISGTPVSEIGAGGVPEIGIEGVPEIGTDQHTSKNKPTSEKQASEKQGNLLLEELRNSIPEPTFKLFVDGVRLVAIEGNTAVIGTPRAYAVDWLQCSLANKVKRLFKVEAMRCIALPA